MKDIIIIGAGITGCFIAHKLSHYEVNVTVIEQENDIAAGTTMANSAIVHTGYDPEEGTLKALLNVQGARMYPAVCRELGCFYHRCGAFITAHKQEEADLQILYERACRRGIRASMLSIEEARKEEPKLHASITKVMSVPDTAVIYPWEIAAALMEEAAENQTHIKLSEKVIAIRKEERFIVETDQGVYEGDYVINAAGVKAEEIASLYEDDLPYHIQPKKGQYYVLSKRAKDFVRHILYPTPTAAGKGVLCVPTVHGNTLLGPTSECCDHEDTSTSKEGLDSIRMRLSTMLYDVPYEEIIRSYSGVRATGNQNDFYIQPSAKEGHFLHVACIDSPGLASSPAIAAYVFDKFFSHEGFCEKAVYHHRTPPVVMEKLSMEDKRKMIEKNPAYGEIVCRCERISKQEIIDAIHRPCGARTIKGIKKRVRPGMGPCQGGFCEPLVAAILAEELGIPLQEVLYDSHSSHLGEIGKGGKG